MTSFAQSTSCAAFEAEAINGPGTAWGVTQGRVILYEPLFVERTAVRLAELSRKHPDNDWTAQAEMLEAEGYDLADPSDMAAKRMRNRP